MEPSAAAKGAEEVEKTNRVNEERERKAKESARARARTHAVSFPLCSSSCKKRLKAEEKKKYRLSSFISTVRERL